MSPDNVLEAKVSHIFSAPPDQVFEAWLDPQMVGRWMFGPAIREEEVVSIEIDPHVGGKFSFLVRRRELVVDHIGTYLKIEWPSRLEFEWGVKGMSDNSRVIVTIEPHDAGCKLTLVHELDPSWAEYFDRCVEGWAEMLDVLERTLKG